MSEYAQVWVNVITDAVDKPFHYRIPSSLKADIEPGCLVKVPFGNRRVWGCVEKKITTPEVSPVKVRELLSVDDPRVSVTSELMQLSWWVSYRYYCRFMEALNLMLPPGHGKVKEKKERYLALSLSAREQPSSFWEEIKRKAPRQFQVLEFLRVNGNTSWAEVSRKTGADAGCLRALYKKELVEVREVVSRDMSWLMGEAFAPAPGSPGKLELTLEQEEVLGEIREAIKKRRRQTFLLHGVTGSGKTEVYLRSIHHCLEKGRKALLLVPEIALTPQMVAYFNQELEGKIVLLHSSLPLRERYQQWLKVKEGSCSVVMGTRSAVFAPLDDIGLIIVDEEQENSYKQEEAPRYHAREVAEWRAGFHSATMVWGSATPSVESYYRSSLEEIRLLKMSSRATPFSLPRVEVVDMRRELKEGHKSIFSRSLMRELETTLNSGEQALLFINRRGFSSFVLCRECGFVLRCPFCSVSLTFHTQASKMMCHYCFYTSVVPTQCPECRGVYIKFFGSGTQKVEQEVKKIFPDHVTIRMDRDSTVRKGSHRELWKRFHSGKASILVGTQMIAKGMDFPGVTLVGVVAADTALHLPDFRAPEKTFQLLAQVSGRAGRGHKKGTVVVQTYQPQHYSITCAREHDYGSFYSEEISMREELQYPPFTEMLRLVWVSREDNAGEEASRVVAENLSGCLKGVEVLGPAPAPLYRLKGNYRYHLILKGHNLQDHHEVVHREVRNFRQTLLGQKVRLTVDFNPVSML